MTREQKKLIRMAKRAQSRSDAILEDFKARNAAAAKRNEELKREHDRLVCESEKLKNR